MSKIIFLDAPNVGALEKEYLSKAIDTNFISTIGPLVPQFEEQFARYLGVKKAVSTQSGTAALHMALYELGIGRGDEVIVPALTFIASVNPISYVGAKPIFVDVDLETWTMIPEDIEKKISKKTKAILVVHLYGNPCVMDTIMKIARKHDLFVIEDATESLGAKYQGKYTGTIGDVGCFSFNGNKTITTGGGGMIVGKDSKRLEHIKFLVNQGRDETRGYFHPEVGFNYRMTNLEAALGLAQIKRLDEFLMKKKKFCEMYTQELHDVKSVSFQKEYPQGKSACWLTCVQFGKNIDVDKIRQRLNERNIQARRIFMPVVAFPPYRGKRMSDYKNSYQIFDRGLCLPSSTLNTLNDIEHVCAALKEVIKKK